MSRTTRLGLSLAPADTAQAFVIFNELVNWLEGGYIELFKPFTEVDVATYDVAEFDYILHVTYTATGTVAITIPTALLVEGRMFRIKDGSGGASTNNITVDCEGSETIDGSATHILSSNYGSIAMYCDGINWFVL